VSIADICSHCDRFALSQLHDSLFQPPYKGRDYVQFLRSSGTPVLASLSRRTADFVWRDFCYSASVVLENPSPLVFKSMFKTDLFIGLLLSNGFVTQILDRVTYRVLNYSSITAIDVMLKEICGN